MKVAIDIGPFWRICMSIKLARSGAVSGTRLAPHGIGDEDQAGQQHRGREDLAHGDPATEQAARLGVRAADKLDDDALDGVADAKDAGGEAGPAQAIEHVGH